MPVPWGTDRHIVGKSRRHGDLRGRRFSKLMQMLSTADAANTIFSSRTSTPRFAGTASLRGTIATCYFIETGEFFKKA